MSTPSKRKSTARYRARLKAKWKKRALRRTGQLRKRKAGGRMSR